MIDFRLNLKLFDGFNAAGSNTMTTTGTANAYTGATTTTAAMTPGMKSYYDTELLENTRDKLIFQQLGKKQSLPANHGKTVEWRKWNKLPDADKLQEGVIPQAKTFGQTALQVTVSQYGEYVAVTDVLDLQHVDDVILGATEELGAASALSYEKRVRAGLRTGTVVRYADGNDGTEYTTADGMVAGEGKKPYLTPTVINKCVTDLKKLSAPAFSGNKYVCVIHPSVSFSLRETEGWMEAHKYSAAEEIFNGEIGELHGVRFIESPLAPVRKVGGKAVYECLFFGKDAFAVIDPAGAGMRTIVKSASQVGGPLEQFSTIGAKFSMGCCILYQERMLRLECMSEYSGVDEANVGGTGTLDDTADMLASRTNEPYTGTGSVDGFASVTNGLKA